jgi:hypothetical protein
VTRRPQASTRNRRRQQTANAAPRLDQQRDQGQRLQDDRKGRLDRLPKAKATTSTTAKTSTANKKVVATRSSPTLNVSLMTEVAPIAAEGAPHPDAGATTAEEPISAATLDALSRARERRLAAGYNRSVAS